MNIQNAIEKAHYAATEQQVETMAAAAYNADAQAELFTLTYLRVLVVHCQGELGNKRRGSRPSVASQLSVVERVSERFYAAALRGVTTPDIAVEEGLEPAERSRRALERNRRSTRYRTSKTTLVNFARGGGDIRTLVPEEVTKASLRAAVSPPESTDKGERQVQRAQGVLLRAIARQARGDPGGARERLEGVIEALQEALETIPTRDVGGSTTTLVRRRTQDQGPARTRVGVPQFHRGA